ncbi:site-2 protease family protein [Candidatus Dojkabacteria bacterium]|nr:site-2 protease family protein [Candidatus Dojkabacteria bacterium]
MPSFIINILLFILVIGILTFVHELGHFLAAKAVGAKVFEFAIGFGPKLISKKIGETEYSIRLLPLGGYVKILGDGDPGEEKTKKGDEKRNLSKKPKWQQIIVMAAGVTMNIFLGIVIFYIVLSSNNWELVLNNEFADFKPIGATVSRVREGDVEYSKLIEDGQAKKAGMPESGILRSINGRQVEYSDDVSKMLASKKNEDVILNVCQEDVCTEYTVTTSEEGKIGILLPANYYMSLSYKENKVFSGFAHVLNNFKLIFSKMKDMFSLAKKTGDYSELSNSVSGPVGIYFVIDYFKQFGVIPFLGMIADLSMSLALINILPIPALDGGRIMILLIEWIVGKELDEKVESRIINISFIFLIILILFIIIKDIVNIDSIRNIFS